MITDATDIADLMARQKVVPVLRTRTVADAIATARVCVDEGMRLIELTTTTPDVADAVAVLAREGAEVGVGTLRSSDQLPVLADAGARFAVSYFDPEGFVRTALDLGLVPIPGVLTPGEMQNAVGKGARILKIFPAWQSNPRIMADMAPLIGEVDYIVTAGLTPELIREWLSAGALAVGAGRALGTVETIGESQVRRNVKDLLDVADQERVIN